jgi:hypothetical protein
MEPSTYINRQGRSLLTALRYDVGRVEDIGVTVGGRRAHAFPAALALELICDGLIQPVGRRMVALTENGRAVANRVQA